MMDAMQAKDVPDAEFLRIVDRLAHDRAWLAMNPRWVLRCEVEEAMPWVPWKVLLAKARSLIKRGLLRGCGCGCRGDYEITEAGLAILAQSPREEGAP